MSAEKIIRDEPTGIFYGWWIVLASMGATAIASVFYWQGFSLFFLELQGEFSTNRAALSGAIALSQLEGGMLGPVGGYLVGRYGPRRMMTIGVIMMGIGFLLMSLVTSLVMFYIVFLAIISVGIGTDNALIITSVSRSWVSHPPTTGKGCTQLTTVPSGALTLTYL